jgi:hypothetical protein
MRVKAKRYYDVKREHVNGEEDKQKKGATHVFKVTVERENLN